MLAERNYPRRNVYACTKCKHNTVQCRFSGNFARTGDRWDHETCAEHDGTVGSFERLSVKIDSIVHYPKLFEREH